MPSINNKKNDNEKIDNISVENIKFDYSDRIYVVFSGGDDFVLVGCWDAIFEFAKDLHEKFKKYVGENKYINFGCAIEIFNKKTSPLYMSQKCEESLNKVKKEKDKYDISVFGKLLNWDTYKDAIQNGKKLIEYMANIKACSRSFIYKLQELLIMKIDFDLCKNVVKNSKWKSLFTYFFTRNIINKIGKNDPKIDELEKFFIDNLFNKNKGGLVAIEYALQATRNI